MASLAGIAAQIESLDAQLALIGAELADQEALLSQRLTQAARVLELQRERASLEGQRARSRAEIARAVELGLGISSPEQIELVKQAALDTQDFVIEKWNERVEASKKIIIDNGNIITELTPEAQQEFMDTVQPIYDKRPGLKDIIEEIRAQQ